MAEPTTSDGVPIVEGMTVWFDDDDDASLMRSLKVSRMTASCVVGTMAEYIHFEWSYSTKRAGLEARESALLAELAAVRRELAGEG